MRIDDTRLKREVSRTAGKPASWNVRLEGDRIDFDRYSDTEDRSDEPFELPLEALKALDAQGEITFEQVRFGDSTIENMRLRVESDDALHRAGAAAGD